MAHTLITEYGKLVDAKLRKDLVVANLFNDKYEGLAVNQAIMIPVRDTEVTVGDYNRTNLGANNITYGSTTYIKAANIKDKFCSEYIDSYEAAGVPDNLIADRLDSTAYQIANTVDTFAVKTLLNAIQGKDSAGTAYTATDPRNGKTGTQLKPASGTKISKSNAFEYAVQAAQKLDEADVPRDGGRFLLVTPAFYAFLLQDSNFVRQGDISQELVAKGAIGQVAGLPVYVCNKLRGEQFGGTTKGDVQAIAGHTDWVTKAIEWKVEPKLVDLDGDLNVVGGSAVKSRSVFTAEVTKPQTLVSISEYFAA